MNSRSLGLKVTATAHSSRPKTAVPVARAGEKGAFWTPGARLNVWRRTAKFVRHERGSQSWADGPGRESDPALDRSQGAGGQSDRKSSLWSDNCLAASTYLVMLTGSCRLLAGTRRKMGANTLSPTAFPFLASL